MHLCVLCLHVPALVCACGVRVGAEAREWVCVCVAAENLGFLIFSINSNNDIIDD